MTLSVQVLKDSSFTARPGKVTVIVSPSGSGKSTIAQLMSQEGIYRRFWQQRAEAIGWKLA